MDTDIVKVSNIFEPNVQYRIPLFQRNYVWSEKEQWKPLWKDILQQQTSDPQEKKMTHFTGAIVVQQQQSLAQPPIYDIIDGQQRLTTFQIVLCAMRDVCKRNEYDDIANDVNRYLTNQGELLKADQRHKIVPTKRDKASFIALLDNDVANSRGRVFSAYSYFYDQIHELVNRDHGKITNLFYTIIDSFGFVRILIDEIDKPEKIFESLNARGKDLFEFDKLRNNLFLRAGENSDDLYEKYWEHFESDYWDPEPEKPKKEGTSCEMFLQHFLMSKLARDDVTPLFSVYENDYQEKLKGEEQTVEDELASLKTYSGIYREMMDCNEKTLIGTRMKFYKTFSLTTMHPFLLFVICDVRLGEIELKRVLDILESYTLRRMLCCKGDGGLTGSNKFFPRLIKNLQGNFSLDKFIQLLAAETSDTHYYPTDSEIRNALYARLELTPLDFPGKETLIFPNDQLMKAALSGFWTQTAGRSKQKLIKYILYRIEQVKQANNKFSEEIVFDNKLSLEHVMPKEWHKTWDLPITPEAVSHNPDTHKVTVNTDVASERKFYHELFDDPNTEPSRDRLAKPTYANAYNLAIVRDAFLENIGNLTLVKQNLNSRLGNRLFVQKKDALKDSILELNREIRKHTEWNVNEIDARSQELITDVCEIWRDLDWFRDQ